jgi:hypothetical protein
MSHLAFLSLSIHFKVSATFNVPYCFFSPLTRVTRAISLIYTADPDPTFHFDAVPAPDPAPLKSDENLRPLVYRPSKAPFLASTPPL